MLASGALLTLAIMIVYPFEMATIVNLAGERTVGTYYGFYNTLAGIGIAAGNLLTGLAVDTGRDRGIPWLPGVALILIGLVCAAAIARLNRQGHLGSHERGMQTAPRPAEVVTR